MKQRLAMLLLLFLGGVFVQTAAAAALSPAQAREALGQMYHPHPHPHPHHHPNPNPNPNPNSSSRLLRYDSDDDRKVSLHELVFAPYHFADFS